LLAFTSVDRRINWRSKVEKKLLAFRFCVGRAQSFVPLV
jgi:hypothetical protein